MRQTWTQTRALRGLLLVPVLAGFVEHDRSSGGRRAVEWPAAAPASLGRAETAAREATWRAAAGRRDAFAARWKINTHLFAANVVLRDLEGDGMVTIPPFGAFAVSPAARQALRAAPASYRAGVLAPDLFPDMYMGGWFLHSDLSTAPERWIADSWMRHVWNRARNFQGTPAERDRVMAFAFGFLTHAAGDMFAHTYVNQKADGAWITFTGPARSTALKHVVLEGFVGEHTPESDLSMDVWPRFVSNVFIKDDEARRHHVGATYYQRWLDLYDWLGRKIPEAERRMNAGVANDAPYWVKCAVHPVICARKEQMESWRLDINRGFRALVDSSQTLGEQLMEGASASGVSAMTGWMNEWVPKMFGAHAIGEGARELADFLQWIGDPLAPINEAIIAEVKRFLANEFPQYYRLYEAVQRPSFWMDSVGFPAGTKQQVLRDMGVPPGGAARFDWRAFEPMYNTITLSKLALLDDTGLNELARRAGLRGPLVSPGQDSNIMLGVFRSMTQSYQWMGEVVRADTGSTRTRFGICGAEGGASVLPLDGPCGIAPSRSGMAGASARVAPGGFVLWQNPEAREKIFRVIFKGFGPGPGSALAEPAWTAEPFSRSERASARALRALSEQLEFVREAAPLVLGKIAGIAPATTDSARSPGVPPTPAPAPPAAGGRLPVRGAPPASVRVPAVTPTATPTVMNWGARCCAGDLKVLRTALAAMQQAGRGLQATVLNRRVSASQVNGLIAEMQMALTAFEQARDASTTMAALETFLRRLETLAAMVNGA